MSRRGISILLLLAVVAGGVLVSRELGNVPVDRANAEQISVEIPAGSSAQAIAERLSAAGVLRSSWGFLLRTILAGARQDLKAGAYVFSRAESGRTILERLRAGDAVSDDIVVTVPEGFTQEEIAARLSTAGVTDKGAFLAAATVERMRGEFPFLQSAPAGTLEGYLFPDTYRFRRGTAAEDVVRRFLRRFDEQFRQLADSPSDLDGHSLHQIVTMASIVEREVRSQEDRRMVAGILWSRLLHGVGLEADATVRYAIHTWDRPLTVEDLAVDSPYNTRRYAGLPPGPIGSPGTHSLQATLDPQDSDYFYYLSARDGTTVFSKTLEEHNAAVQTHLR